MLAKGYLKGDRLVFSGYCHSILFSSSMSCKFDGLRLSSYYIQYM